MDDHLSGLDPTTIEEAMKALTCTQAASMVEENLSFTRSGTFAFLSLPGELRNRIYELLLVDTRGPDDFCDTVILVNDLNRRKERRRTHGLHPLSTGRSKKSQALAKRHDMYNETEVTLKRLKKRVLGLPPLLETSILRLCHQTHQEGSYILYSRNTFAVTVRPSRHKEPFGAKFSNLELPTSRIQRLRLEVHVEAPNCQYDPAQFRRLDTWSSFRDMTSLKSLQLVVTLCDEPDGWNQTHFFNYFWRRRPIYYHTMQHVIANIPKGVEVNLGLTKEGKAIGDYSGVEPVEGCVLRKIFQIYGCFQGTGLDMNNEVVRKRTDMISLLIDSDGEDSDGEDSDGEDSDGEDSDGEDSDEELEN